ncbi:MAG: serine protein kinase RIO [Candidatus Geothermarchaeales archaeon]
MDVPKEDREPGKALRKLGRKEASSEREQRMLRRISDEYETLEEVFDRKTLFILYRMINEGIIEIVHGIVASGKEARIYVAETSRGEAAAVKIFLTATAEFRRGRLKYIVGDPRFEGVSTRSRKLIYAWASKEYKNLLKAHGCGVNVPKPLHHEGNVLVMEFIGRDFIPASTLRERERLSERLFKQVMNQTRRLYQKAGLIHADLSEFNIFYFNRKAILFDFAQAVLKGHPMAEQFLVRDVSNILNFFSRRGLGVWSLEEAMNWVKEA